MVFVGNGALLKHGIEYSLLKKYSVEMIFCSSTELVPYFERNGLLFRVIEDVNDEIETFKKLAGDKVVFSLNNPWILRQGLLNLPEFRFYNIHNGILPAYRGMPAVCIIYAILNGEGEYGVSLHEMDAGIDTGKCIDIMRFPCSNKDTFEQVMTKSLQYCKDIFEANLGRIMDMEYRYIPINKSSSRLYSIKDLAALGLHQSNVNFRRATHLGVYRIWYKGIHELITKKVPQ
jgi:methionyl-tRNA formyltransferase